ncbi:MAG: hypothetical protein LBE35_05360 [Clostridiales bacterium]|jgi:hypothetical protein|nr:hypothetical protein [Clostridiales bacterium]
MKRIWAIISSNWISSITLFLSAIGVIIGFFAQAFSFQAISFMFLLLAAQNFSMTAYTLPQINAKLDSMTSGGHDLVRLKTRRHLRPLQEIVENAKEELFVSGATLRSWGVVEDLLLSKKELKIKILLYNFDNPELKAAHIAMMGLDADHKFTLDHLDDLWKHPNVELRKIDSIMPSFYVATDMDTAEGYIKVEGYFNNCSSALNYPNYELTPENKELYDIHKEQIEALWGEER